MDPKQSRTFIAVTGLALIAGFFLPWISFGGLGASGWFFASHSSASAFIWLIPVGGIAMVATALTGSRYAKVTSAAVGLALVGYAVVKTVHSFFSTTGIGLWLVIAASLAALALPLITRPER
jgi:hypothetical protein